MRGTRQRPHRFDAGVQHVAVEGLLRALGRVDLAEIEKAVLANKHGRCSRHSLNVAAAANEEVFVGSAYTGETCVKIRRDIRNGSAAHCGRQHAIQHPQIMQRGQCCCYRAANIQRYDLRYGTDTLVSASAARVTARVFVLDEPATVSGHCLGARSATSCGK